MHFSFKVIAVIALALMVPAAARAEKKPDKPKQSAKQAGKKSDSAKTAAKGAATIDDGKMSIPIPKGHDSKGLTIPYFGDDGKLQMTFTIGVASRVDDIHVKMNELRVETFDARGRSEMLIAMPISMLDLNTRILTTKEGVTIKRSDFEISGQSMEFDTKTKQGRLAGGVRMIIYNLEQETAERAGEGAGE